MIGHVLNDMLQDKCVDMSSPIPVKLTITIQTYYYTQKKISAYILKGAS